MSAQTLRFDPWLQQPLEAGVISPQEAWSLEVDCLLNPDQWIPLALHPAWSKVDLFHLELPMQ